MNHKKLKYFIIIGVFLSLVIFLAGELDLVNLPKAEIGGPKTVKLCYLKADKSVSGSNGEYNLILEITSDKAEGELNFLPADDIAKTGSFKGKVTKIHSDANEREASLQWNVLTGGDQIREELKIIFNEEVASVGFGLMTEKSDGVFIYRNPENVAYTLSLNRAECPKR